MVDIKNVMWKIIRYYRRLPELLLIAIGAVLCASFTVLFSTFIEVFIFSQVKNLLLVSTNTTTNATSDPCSSGKCDCQQYNYYDEAFKLCVSQKFVNETCSTTIECRSDLGLQCTSNQCQCLPPKSQWNSIDNKCWFPTYGYTNCSNNAQCDSTKYLICNSGTSLCNCPKTSISGMCDCIRLTANETYWNGSTCTPALTFGSFCSSFNTNYMCQTLTEGTICNNTSGSYKCECPNLNYFNIADGNCTAQLTYNQTCTESDACRPDQGLSCQNGTCNCQTMNTSWSLNLTACIGQQTYTEACKTSFECDSKLGLICNNGYSCNCPSTLSSGTCDCTRAINNEFYWNSSSCTTALSYGSSCTSDSTSYMCQTLTQNTICNNSTGSFICECPNLSYFDTTFSNCTAQMSYNETCNQTNACRSDQGLFCNNGTCDCNTTIEFWSFSSNICTTYHNYTESCTANRECNPSFNLICNSGASCNCPLTSSLNKCDCTRVIGNESYWNGTNCETALLYNTSCNDSSTSYMCQTMTQSTVCGNSSGSFTCECPATKYFDINLNSCNNYLTINQTCSQSNACNITQGLSCQSGVCSCNSTIQFWLTSSSMCVNYRNYTDNCTLNGDCNPNLNLICNSGSQCNCPTTLSYGKCDCLRLYGNESYWNGTSCKTALSFGSSCSSSYMCQSITQGTICNNSVGIYVCECSYLQYYNTSTSNCTAQLNYNDTCSQSNACRSDQSLSCMSGTCMCNTTYSFWSTTLKKCVNYYSYSQSCNSTSECDSRLNLICNSGGSTCNCPTALGNYKCDCVRTLVNEMFWNGTSCAASRSYLQPCTIGANYMCKSLTQNTMCNSSGVCSCGNGTYGGFNQTIGKCVYCNPSWNYVSGSCYTVTTITGPSSSNGSSTTIQSACGISTARLAKLNNIDVYNYAAGFQSSKGQYWVDATYNTPTGQLVSFDGTWIINSTYFCTTPSTGCAYLDQSKGGKSASCFRTTTCTTNLNYFCQYSP